MVTDRRRAPDRRKEERFSVNIDVDWEGVVGQKKGTISDISEAGCFVMCSGEVEDGESVNVFLPLKSGMKLQFKGEVVNHFLEIGYAVRFVELSPAQKEFLKKFVESLRQK